MTKAARVTDPTSHPGVISGPGDPSVTIGGKPAAVMGDTHTCAFPPPSGPHAPNTIIKGSATVTIGGKPAARVNDSTACGATIVSGALNVFIGG